MKQTLWIKDKWDEVKGRSISIKIKKKIISLKSKFQRIDIYLTECFGRMLLLDDVIMLTEFDEFSYHEMITHVAMHSHPAPKKVLIIGGGDGGTAREVLKHEVEEVHLCEIDDEVVKISKKYLPFTSSSYKDKRIKIFFEDGARFIKERKNFYDVIIVDSSDPIGPAKKLFGLNFYRDMHDSIKKDGIIITQSESMFYDRKLIRKLFDFNLKMFPVVKYYYTLVPTYPSGTIGFSFCSKKYDPLKNHKEKNIKNLKYYNHDIHRASFILPGFMENIAR